MLALDQKNELQNERGVALLLTMILMIVLSLLTVSMFELLKASTQIAGNHKQDLQAMFIADAGVEDAINQLRNVPTLADPPAPDLTLAAVDFAGGSYTVTIKDTGTTNAVFFREKDITSTGTFRGVTRIIKAHVGIFAISGKKDDLYAVATSSWRLL